VRLDPDDLREALRHHAASVVPDDPDPLIGLEKRIRSVRRRRRWLATATSAVAVLVVVLTAPLLRQTAPAPEPPNVPPPTSPAAVPAVPVYYLYDGRLAREFRQLGPVRDRVAAAVDAMLQLPPLDPDYRSGWPRSARATVRRDGAGFVIDLSRRPTSGCPAVQQLVHTVTAAAPSSAPVVVLVRGRPVHEESGLRACVAAGGANRDAALRTLVAVQISSPNHGTRVGRSFLLTGSSRVVEGTLTWQVRDAATGAPLADGAPAGDVNSSDGWTVQVDLPANAAGRDVLLEVSGTPAAGAAVGTDTKRLHVTG
jgi:hypothetical protein